MNIKKQRKIGNDFSILYAARSRLCEYVAVLGLQNTQTKDRRIQKAA